MRKTAALLLAWALAAPAAGQDVSLEYRVKAAYLFNFTKFIEWPESAIPGTEPFRICVAGRNPFGTVLEETIKGETVQGRPLEARVMRAPDPGCHVVFVPSGVRPEPYLRAAPAAPRLTVGESAEFLREGGIVNFVVAEGKVRFEINQSAAARAQLRISSRLLRLARGGDRATIEPHMGGSAQ